MSFSASNNNNNTNVPGGIGGVNEPLLLQHHPSITKPKSGSIVNWEPVVDRAAHHTNYPQVDEQEIERHRAVYYIGFSGGPGNGSNDLSGEPHNRRKRSRRRRSSAHHHASHHGDRKNGTDADYDNIVDPAEHVHFMLEERAGEDGNGLGAEDGAVPGYGRLFIQMDELRMPTTIATIGPGSGSTGTGTNGSPREGGAVPGAAGGIGYSAPAWEEVARWVKFEEDVEPGSNRWSKPRVATLALHSLLELRSCILNGVLILDMEATHLGDIENQLIDSLLTANQITKELEEEVRSVLRAPHIPQYLKMSTFRATASKSHFPNISSFPILAGYHGKFPNSTINVPALATATPIGNGGETQTGVSNSTTVGNQSLTRSLHHSKTSPSPLSPSQSYAHNVGPAALAAAGNQQVVADDLPLKGNLHFMKKLPENAEAAHVLIGEAEFLTNPIIAFVRLRESAFLGDMTEVPIPSRFIFLLLGPLGHLERYHEIGRCLATLMSDEVFHDVAYKSKNIQDILAGVDEFLDQVIVLPPGEWDPTIRIQPPLNVPPQHNRIAKKSDKYAPEKALLVSESHGEELIRTGRFCGGLIDDVKRKWRWYFWSDFTDAFNLKCLASFFFLYFACLAPIVTFGGLLGDATGHNLATIESLLSGALCGVTWALFSGQPLTIMGSTGPILVFESIVFSFCRDHGLSYLSFRCCIGLWTALILLIMVVTDASVLVKYVTRFTEELFASLISLIFVYHALKNLYHIAEDFPVLRHKPLPFRNGSFPPLRGRGGGGGSSQASLPLANSLGIPYVSDVFLLSMVQFMGTFILAVVLKGFRNTRYFPILVRTTISDFAVLFSVLIMLGVDYYYSIATPKLMVPSDFRPTSHSRKGWMVNPIGGNPWWTTLATVFPALLATILIFLDQQITAVIINRKENLLKKGCGYHLDLLVLSILVIICSLMGLPWFVAATVLSITHVNSLRKETECSAPGERPKFLGIMEQRVTGLLVFIFIGLSVTMTSVLRRIPMPVLYGIFLYMGISSLKGVQFIQRILILFMPQKYQPDYMFLRSVKTYRVHIFTGIQFLSLVALWVIKSNKKISITFPIMVAALVGIRKLMEKLFTHRELEVLDDVMPESEKKRKSIDKNDASYDVKNGDGDVEGGPKVNAQHGPKGNGGLITSPLLPINTRLSRIDSSDINFDATPKNNTEGLDSGTKPNTTSNTTTTPVSPPSTHNDLMGLSVPIHPPSRISTITALDSMNITREMERTNVWKTVAKEKFIHSASAAALPTNSGVSHKSHHHRKKKHSSHHENGPAPHDTGFNSNAPRITIDGAKENGENERDVVSRQIDSGNGLTNLIEDQSEKAENPLNLDPIPTQVSSSSSNYSFSSQNPLHTPQPEKFSIKIGSDEEDEVRNNLGKDNHFKSRQKNNNTKDPATESLLDTDEHANGSDNKMKNYDGKKAKDLKHNITNGDDYSGKGNGEDVPLVDIRK